jgi:hypothetical protein
MRAFDEQFLDVMRVGEHYVVRGALDLPGGAALRTLLDRERDRQHRQGLLPQSPPPTGDPVVDEAAEERSRRLAAPHQNALALSRLVRVWLDDEQAGSHHGAAPHITLLVAVDDLDTDRPGELDVPGEGAPVLVPAETVRRLLCDAEVTEILTRGSEPDLPPPTCCGRCHPTAHAPGRPRPSCCGTSPELPRRSAAYLPQRHRLWNHGRTLRTASARLWRALVARDRHCAFPGCRVGPSWCEAHHVVEWELGGETSIDNLTLLCSRHHHLVHEGGWRLLARDDHDSAHPGHWTARPPDP